MRSSMHKRQLVASVILPRQISNGRKRLITARGTAGNHSPARSIRGPVRSARDTKTASGLKTDWLPAAARKDHRTAIRQHCIHRQEIGSL
ncbi:hypothetical protein BAUCODRAFT_435784 [Baudoinia panamericana UAMH 10762]|uniref:Uncharacterized protein n=1 Tax=Baudoinia panamericana (strain UAMH 10762) TaxID=717646 RepID=M2NCV7_BAUPA|nr:uncharacterized protein BAUCODRAFT_435784 [Baudoinia panamericana UAMH 10762]EMC97019.1 hypothetical protein BAUCODRAFT_435784 [Baudoinia panamericana UAMH 10762]